jgi:hypothetical protein
MMRFAKVKEEPAKRAGDTQQSASSGGFIKHGRIDPFPNNSDTTL